MTDGRGKLVLQSGHGLITRSNRLVRRGLNDLLKNEGIHHWQHLTHKELFGEIKKTALQLILDDDNNTDAINALGMKFVLISSGKFMMGSDKKDDKQPIHAVSLAKPFFMACHPVMESEWREVMKTSPERLTADGKAVGGISWEDAGEFINRLNLLNEELYLSAKKYGDSRQGNQR